MRNILKKLKLIDEAEHELSQITLQYAQENEDLALRFFQATTDAFSEIARHPKIGVPFRKNYRKFVLTKFPYNIFYEEMEADIEVMSIAHQSRKPGYWNRRS